MRAEILKIVGFCTLASVVYGIVHDQITARICVEYFTVFHPDVFHTTDPTLLGLGWGIIATWWMGAFLGGALGFACQVGKAPKIGWRKLVRQVLGVLIFMGVCAALAGKVGSTVSASSLLPAVPPGASHSAFYTCLFAHNASYFSGALGAMVLITWFMYHRFIKASPTEH
ncbi:MAG TPA: hypothetical protein VK171_08340 [Fimbriimonas sp.]|nr:hypothetical protein [Fimbriimonas sp.]